MVTGVEVRAGWVVNLAGVLEAACPEAALGVGPGVTSVVAHQAVLLVMVAVASSLAVILVVGLKEKFELLIQDHRNCDSHLCNLIVS